jgi:hypothetical protein
MGLVPFVRLLHAGNRAGRRNRVRDGSNAWTRVSAAEPLQRRVCPSWSNREQLFLGVRAVSTL